MPNRSHVEPGGGGSDREHRAPNGRCAVSNSAAVIPYVAAKRAAEECALQPGRDVVVTNPAFLVGPDDPEPSVMGRFAFDIGRDGYRSSLPAVSTWSTSATWRWLTFWPQNTGELDVAISLAVGRSFPEIFDMLARVAGYRPRWSPRVSSGWMQALAMLTETRAFGLAVSPIRRWDTFV